MLPEGFDSRFDWRHQMEHISIIICSSGFDRNVFTVIMKRFVYCKKDQLTIAVLQPNNWLLRRPYFNKITYLTFLTRIPTASPFPSSYFQYMRKAVKYKEVIRDKLFPNHKSNLNICYKIACIHDGKEPLIILFSEKSKPFKSFANLHGKHAFTNNKTNTRIGRRVYGNPAIFL